MLVYKCEPDLHRNENVPTYQGISLIIDYSFGHQISSGKASSSGLAVAIGCGVAGAIVGTASIAFATKRILAHRARAAYDLLDEPQPDAP